MEVNKLNNSPTWQLANFEVPQRYTNIGWDSLVDISASDKKVADDYVSAFGDFSGTDKTSLYLSSEISGTGKTSFAICLARDLIRAKKLDTFCIFKPYLLLMEELRQDGDSILRSTVFEKIKRSSFVIFDDIGVEKFNRSKAERYYQVMDYMWQEMKPAIFTSKFTINKLVNRVDDTVEIELVESIASRLVGMCTEHVLGNRGDFRNV